MLEIAGAIVICALLFLGVPIGSTLIAAWMADLPIRRAETKSPAGLSDDGVS